MRTIQDMAWVATAALVAALAAPSSAVGQPGGERFATFEMTRPVIKADAAAARARAVAEVMIGQPLRRPAVVVPIKSTGGGTRRLQVTLPEAPALDIVYLPDYDELRVVDTELAASIAPQGELQEDEAVKLARRTFDEMASRKVVDPRHYDWTRAEVSSTWVGSGSLDGKVDERKRVEYRVTLRRSINGVEMANAGIRIAIHASGGVAGVRLGGVAVASKATQAGEEPTGKGRWFTRQVSNDDLRARFERDLVPDKAKARIAWSRVMYVMPESKRSALVEPLYVVSYSLEVPTDAGETAVSRRLTRGLSLVDPRALPVDLTPPARTPVTERARKQAVEKGGSTPQR